MRGRIIFGLILLVCLIGCRHDKNNLDGWAFRTSVNRGWGIIGTDGKVIVSDGTYVYQPSSVVNGMFTVPDGTGMVMLYSIDDVTRPICERHFYRIGYFLDKVTIAQDTMNGFLSIINRKGQTIAVLNFPQYDIVAAHNFHEGRALVISKDGKYGYIDTKGTLIIPPIYDIAYDYQENKALVGVADMNGNINYQIIKKDGNIAFQLQQNNVTIDHYFSEGMLMYKENDTGRCRYINSKGETCISLPDKIRDCYRFEGGKTVYQTNSGAGIIDNKGRSIIGDVYEDMAIGGKDYYYAKKDNRWGVVDKTGKPLSSFCYDKIGKSNKHHIAVAEMNGTFSLINGQGKTIGRYAKIVDDPYAEGDVSATFVRSPVNTMTYQQGEIKPLPTAKDINNKVLAYPQSLKKIVAPRAVRINTDWRKISRNSPFYGEAAKVLSGNLTEIDAQNREMILNYVEHLRSSYTTKDIDFLQQLFSENALIVVGHVVRTSMQRESQYLPASQVVYNVKSKQEYLSKLKLVFKLNKQIQLHFSDFHIMRHPTTPGIYGVSLRQQYSSDRYSDDGYLFLLWDFRNEAEPKIHVRTWQPYNIDEHHTLSGDAVFNIRDFNLQ